MFFLTFVAFNPLCTYFDNRNANAASDKAQKIQMQCYLIYWGNWAPKMEWRQVLGGSSRGGESSVSVKEGVYRSSSDNFVSIAITVAGNNCRLETSYKCVTGFTATRNHVNTTATNIPDYSFIWSTSVCSRHSKNLNLNTSLITPKGVMLKTTISFNRNML